MITNKRNSHGLKNSSEKYRNGGKFFQWSYWYKKDPINEPDMTYSIETKEERREALDFWKNEDQSREYKAVKMKDGFYEIFATDPIK